MTAELGRSSMSIAAFLAALFVLMPDIAISMQDDPCKPAWEVGPFFPPGVDRSGSVMAVFDDGRGEALYVAGDLISAGGRQVSLIGRWDGQRWESVEDASGLGLGGGGVAALAVYDDGRGPALYAAGSFDRAGGQFVRGIARWDGAQWEPLEGPLGIGVEGTAQAMAVYDPGDGARLYIGGLFDRAGGISASNIVSWDGQQFARLGSGFGAGVDNRVLDLEVFEEPDGHKLFVGGIFDNALGVPTEGIARWDGQDWSAVGAIAGDYQAAAMEVFDDGSGPQLYVAGGDLNTGADTIEDLARWDGTQWSAVSDLVFEGGTPSALCVRQQGDERILYVSGDFDSIGFLPSRGIVQWDGAEWASMDRGVAGSVNAMQGWDDGSGWRLFATGGFTTTDSGLFARGFATWDGNAWGAIGEGLTTSGIGSAILFDSGDGPQLHVAGGFTSIGSTIADRIARWDGEAWQSLGRGVGGDGTGNSINAVAIFDDGRGPALYVAGRFQRAGRAPVQNIARWDGDTWEPVGVGLGGDVHALVVHDDGTGPALYAGGDFGTADGQPALRVARWDGSQWQAVGSGVSASVETMVVYDEGAGPRLFVGGFFTSAGAQPALRIARWDGASWTAVGTMDNPGADDAVLTLMVFDDGRGPALYAGGRFRSISGAQAEHIAQWDGNDWKPVGGGVNQNVFALAVHDDGQGPALFASGDFRQVGVNPDRISAQRIAKWDGADWSPLQFGLDARARVLLSDTRDDVPRLWALGGFTSASEHPTGQIAQWVGCGPSCRADLDGDGVLTLFDFLAFQNAFAMGDPIADFDGNGELNLFDFLAFQNEFAAGCP